VKELIEKHINPFVKNVAEKYVKPIAGKVANAQISRAAKAFFDKYVKTFVRSVNEKYFLPVKKGISERLVKPAAKSAVGQFVIGIVKHIFDKYVRPVTLDTFNKYVKPERRKLFKYALITWVVLSSAVFVNWPRLVYHAFEEMFATDFSGTQWRIESETGGKGVFVKLAQRGAVEYNSLEADNYVPLSGAEWGRVGRNGLRIKIGDGRFSAVAPDPGERRELEVGNDSQSSYGQYKRGATSGNWYLASTQGGQTRTARQSVDSDREQLQALVGSLDRPAIHFIRRMEVPIPGHVFSERCTEMARLLHRKELYFLWSVVRVKGAGSDGQAYLMLRDTSDGQPTRISAGEGTGTVPVEVMSAVSLAPGDPVLENKLKQLNTSCGLGASPIAGNGHLNIPVLALVIPEGQGELKFDELRKVFQELVAKLALSRNQVAGDVLVLNVPPRGEEGVGGDDVRYNDLEGFVRTSAKEVQIEPVRIEPVRRRVIRKLAR
jgi:hypothetical protein